MKSLLTTLAAFITLAISATAQNEKSAGLKVLDRFAGTWDIDFTYKPADGGEEFKAKAVSYRTWSTKGTILRFDDPGLPDQPELQLLITYDPEAGNYPGVILSGAARSEITGTWDEKSQTMSFKSTLPDGGTIESTHRFIDADHADPKGVLKNADGEVVAEFGWKQTRRKKTTAEALPTVDELIAAYHKAMGGFEANKKITTRRISGTLSMAGTTEPWKMTFTQKAPDLAHNKIEIPGFGHAFEGHDGKVAWKSNASEGSVELQGAERTQKVRDYQFHKYLDLKSEFKTVTSKGRQTIERKTYDVLAVTREAGSSETLYFDVGTHLLSMVKHPDFTIELSNYQKTDGIPYPCTNVLSTADGTTMLTVSFDKVEHGVKVDDAIFAMPKE